MKNDEKAMFKSYYVVWKPRFSPHIRGGKCRFKSYYVVWKPDPQFIANASLKGGLNRTMQYGNGGDLLKNPIIVGRLNRTMQYGNQNIYGF